MTDQPTHPTPRYPVGSYVRLSLPGEKPLYGKVVKICQDGQLILHVGMPPHHETFICHPREVKRA